LAFQFRMIIQRNSKVDSIVRVDHAGELGAIRIYDGQLTILRNSESGAKIQEMRDQEQAHVDVFRRLVRERRVRPSLLLPVFNLGAYAMGVGSALLGKEAAMACTEAVEEVISSHYNDQLREVIQDLPDDSELREILKTFRDDEQSHREIAIEENSKNAPLYQLLFPAFKGITQAAVWVATRV